ncbi:aspartate/glutamate racemase family protein [Salipiger pacificus]|uniref:Aspartate/glutamate racemase family protein n=1 Tax=Salipiger mangrovisoli TaxID=2865933 RepID=A0ABR9X035_9RHOB|nr:aspartate/glutamate racemase family protein [Salipiger mangrovisoli]
MSARKGLPVVTTAAAVVDALRATGARRISVATPDHEALNQHEMHFLQGHGFDVLAIRGLGIGAGGPAAFSRIARTPPDEVRAHVRETVAAGTEAVLLACTDFPSLPLVAELEQALGVPVISPNTATLRAALLAAGLPASAAPAFRCLPHRASG